MFISRDHRGIHLHMEVLNLKFGAISIRIHLFFLPCQLDTFIVDPTKLISDKLIIPLYGMHCALVHSLEQNLITQNLANVKSPINGLGWGYQQGHLEQTLGKQVVGG